MSNKNLRLEDALTNQQIEHEFRRLHENANIVYLSNFNYKNLDELFNGTNHVIIFVSTVSINSGHWQLLLRNKNNLFFFDSYGHNFSKLLHDVFQMYGENAYNQTYQLGELLQGSELPVYMNTVQYQEKNQEIETCGYHCLCCFSVFLSMPEEFTFELYNKFMNNYKKAHKLKTYDDVAVMVTRI